jgi:hypothetical protein
MSVSFTPTAIWMTVENGIPRQHRTRYDAIEFARQHHLPAYRQDQHDKRVDQVYDPVGRVEHAPGVFTVIPPRSVAR